MTHGSAADVCWTEESDRLLIRMVDSLHDRSKVDDGLWHELSRCFDEAQLLDMLFLCGWYHAISFAANAARVGLEDDAPRFSDFPP